MASLGMKQPWGIIRPCFPLGKSPTAQLADWFSKRWALSRKVENESPQEHVLTHTYFLTYDGGLGEVASSLFFNIPALFPQPAVC